MNRKWKWIGWVTLLGVLVFSFSWGTRYRARWALGSRMWIDEAYNLQVPYRLKNFGEYAGQNTTGTGTRVETGDLFDPRITTGPSVLLPITALYSKGGSGEELARAGRAFLFWVFVANLLLLPWIGFSLGMRSAGVVLLGLIPALTFHRLETWAQVSNEVLGEGPGFFYMLLGFLLLSFRGKVSVSRERTVGILGGLCLGLAISAKLILALPIGLFLLWYSWAFSALKWSFLWVAPSLLLPTVLFEIAQLGTLGWDGYHLLKEKAREALSTTSGGAITHEKIFSATWFENFRFHLYVVQREILSIPILFVFSAAGIFYWIRRAAWRRLETGVLIAGAGLIGWFIFLSANGMFRHLTPGTMLAVSGGLIALSFEAERLWLSRFPSLITQKGMRNLLLCFSCVALGVTAVRMSKPVRAELAEQSQFWRQVSEFDQKKPTKWILQNPKGSDPYLFYFVGTSISPLTLLNPFKGPCPLLKIDPSIQYGFLKDSAIEVSFSRYHCGKVPKNLSVYSKVELEVCPGSEVVCVPGK